MSINKIKKILKENPNKIKSDLIKKELFDIYFPSLNYEEYINSDLWYSIIFLDLGIEIPYHLNEKSLKKASDLKGLWGAGDVGPVG